VTSERSPKIAFRAIICRRLEPSSAVDRTSRKHPCVCVRVRSNGGMMISEGKLVETPLCSTSSTSDVT
jgi:hypothetical protein